MKESDIEKFEEFEKKFFELEISTVYSIIQVKIKNIYKNNNNLLKLICNCQIVFSDLKGCKLHGH